MQEIAVNVPFDADEVKEISVQEFRKRLDGLSPLTGSKEYAAFSLDFNVKIRLRRSGETNVDAKETLAWGTVEKGDQVASDGDETEEVASKFESLDPNDERQARDMPMTVESKDGKGGHVRRKVKVKR